jgi:putative DNA primase/helicase
MISAQQIKDAARGRWREILTDVAGIPADMLDGKHHGCPRCGGKDRFRLIDADLGAVFCNQCFAKGNGDGIAAVGWMQGVGFSDSLREIASFLGLSNANGNGSRNLIARYCQAKRIAVASFTCYGAAIVTHKGSEVARVPMYGDDGKPCSYCDFGLTGKLSKGLYAAKKPAGLFLPHQDGAVLLPAAGEMWLLTEGVKDAAALHALGYFAAGLPTSSLNARFARLFAGVAVVMVPDLDEAGLRGAEQSAARLKAIASTVVTARLPGEITPARGADVRDVLAKPDGETLVRQAINDALAVADEAKAARPDYRIDAEGRTEVANGARIIAVHGAQLRWCDAWKTWLVWDGRRWRDDDQRSVDAMAKATLNELFRAAAWAYEHVSDDAGGKMLTFARSSNSKRGIENALALARSEPGIPITPDQLDADGWRLNVANGTLDLRTGQLRPHDRADLCTKLADVTYDADAECPMFREFLRAVLPDVAVRQFVQRAAGMSLVGEVRDHVLLLCYGSGANGKSTLLNALLAMLGDYAMQGPENMLLEVRSDSHKSELAALFGKRFVACIEAGAGRRLAESLVKSITGGDAITARRLYQDFFTFKPTHTVWMAANHRPRVSGQDDGIWRRVLLIPFTQTIPPAERDAELPAKLRRELPGILNWALFGLTAWREDGLQPPDAVMAATQDYRTAEDALADFLAECCQISTGCQVERREIYGAYTRWCERHGWKPWAARRLYAGLEERGFRPYRTPRGRGFEGLAVAQQ